MEMRCDDLLSLISSRFFFFFFENEISTLLSGKGPKGKFLGFHERSAKKKRKRKSEEEQRRRSEKSSGCILTFFIMPTLAEKNRRSLFGGNVFKNPARY